MRTRYEEYAILDAQIKALTAQKDSVKAKIIEEMIDSGEEKVATGVGKFTVTPLKSWKYSERVAEMKENLDALKAEEESLMIATYEEKPSLRFTPNKL